MVDRRVDRLGCAKMFGLRPMKAGILRDQLPGNVLELTDDCVHLSL